MDNRRVKFCLKILSRFGKIIRKPQGVKFFGAPCTCLTVIIAVATVVLYCIPMKTSTQKTKSYISVSFRNFGHNNCK